MELGLVWAVSDGGDWGQVASGANSTVAASGASGHVTVGVNGHATVGANGAIAAVGAYGPNAAGGDITAGGD